MEVQKGHTFTTPLALQASTRPTHAQIFRCIYFKLWIYIHLFKFLFILCANQNKLDYVCHLHLHGKTYVRKEKKRILGFLHHK
jgi:hypothetical protein